MNRKLIIFSSLLLMLTACGNENQHNSKEDEISKNQEKSKSKEKKVENSSEVKRSSYKEGPNVGELTTNEDGISHYNFPKIDTKEFGESIILNKFNIKGLGMRKDYDADYGVLGKPSKNDDVNLVFDNFSFVSDGNFVTDFNLEVAEQNVNVDSLLKIWGVEKEAIEDYDSYILDENLTGDNNIRIKFDEDRIVQTITLLRYGDVNSEKAEDEQTTENKGVKEKAGLSKLYGYPDEDLEHTEVEYFDEGVKYTATSDEEYINRIQIETDEDNPINLDLDFDLIDEKVRPYMHEDVEYLGQNEGDEHLYYSKELNRYYNASVIWDTSILLEETTETDSDVADDSLKESSDMYEEEDVPKTPDADAQRMRGGGTGY